MTILNTFLLKTTQPIATMLLAKDIFQLFLFSFPIQCKIDVTIKLGCHEKVL